MSLPYCNGIKIRALNQDAGHVAVQSSAESTFMLMRRRWALPGLHAMTMEKAIGPNEVVHIKAQSESAAPEIEIIPMGDPAGTIYCQSNREARKVLRVGAKYRFDMRPGEALVFYSPNIQHPVGNQGSPGAVV